MLPLPGLYDHVKEPFSKKCDVLGTKNDNAGDGGLPQRLSIKISSNIRHTITQSHCWYCHCWLCLDKMTNKLTEHH